MMKNKHALWALFALLTTFPLTAIFHHAIFYRPTCILNSFGSDYRTEVILLWLQNDPSLLFAVLGASSIWITGLYRTQFQYWIIAFLITFLPLSIWVWDIPFTDRLICHLFHDGKTPLHARHLYLLGITLWIPTAILLRKVWRTDNV